MRLARTLAISACALACSRVTPRSGEAGADAMVVLAPLEERPAEAKVPVPVPSPAPWALEYADSDDLPADAGDARCPSPPAQARSVSVRLELVTRPKPSIELVIPSLSVRRRLWNVSRNPNSCGASLDASSLRFGCGEDLSSLSGRVYARRSDVIVGERSSRGTRQTRFLLPCGTTARFEAVVCPPRCESAAPRCECSELSPRWGAPGPAPSR